MGFHFQGTLVPEYSGVLVDQEAMEEYERLVDPQTFVDEVAPCRMS
jgi:hypothetical protein